MVLLTADVDAGAKKLAKVAKEKGIKNVPLTAFDQEGGPRLYRIAENAAVTLLQWNRNKLTINRGFLNATLTDESRKEFTADAGKMLGD